MTDGTLADLVATRTELLVRALGNVTRVAECLGVSRTVVSRWRAGTLLPTLAQARLLVDLDHVVARASIIFEPPAIWNWLSGSNSHLEGARPIDVLQIRGASAVVEALDAAEQLEFG
ncbi:antitoxin Xre/MbcA/ParS toxin-binding domain-containing protein [Nocardioides sediminis]|uniref:antitoxin Xre/MbcA/ParS toxin-binding domain-containing protein n=1 Tax=Nocardioides sediminis TaxID=433648 RepID=UPI00131F0F31|nr:antitoxin Xre/MbcA/ParS toxin-binding domain-containing protein [Nocardioides sediminis]